MPIHTHKYIWTVKLTRTKKWKKNYSEPPHTHTHAQKKKKKRKEREKKKVYVRVYVI